MEFLAVENIVRIPLDKVQSVLEFLNWFLKQSSVSARVFLSLLGQLNATAQFVILGRLHLCPLQIALFAQWKPHVLPLTHKILISYQIKHHLKWWTNRDRFIQGVPLKPVQETHTLFTDASVSSWGAHLELEGLLFHGVWTNDQSQLHINVLEMMAISMALERAPHVIHNTTVMIATDSPSVVSYIIKLGVGGRGGGHSPPLCMEVCNFLLWCHQKGEQLWKSDISLADSTSWQTVCQERWNLFRPNGVSIRQ